MSELSDETRDLIARGREGASLSPERRDAIRAGVVAQIAAGAVVGTVTAKAAAGAGWAAALKVIGIATAVAVVGGSAAVIVEHRAARTEAARIASARAATARAANENVAAPTDTLATAPASAAPPSTPLADTIAPAQATRGIAASPGAPPRSTPVATDSPAATAGGGEPRGTAGTIAPVRGGSSLEAETRLLRDAHRALSAGDAAQCLRLLDEHAARFPRSALAPERSAERVFALCAAKQPDAARSAADAFLAANPAGPLAARVRASCVSPRP